MDSNTSVERENIRTEQGEANKRKRSEKSDDETFLGNSEIDEGGASSSSMSVEFPSMKSRPLREKNTDEKVAKKNMSPLNFRKLNKMEVTFEEDESPDSKSSEDDSFSESEIEEIFNAKKRFREMFNVANRILSEKKKSGEFSNYSGCRCLCQTLPKTECHSLCKICYQCRKCDYSYKRT